ncbi:MAG: hypothetical protein AAFQ80_25530 [Cyanobacteria bacterium J06621_8]
MDTNELLNTLFLAAIAILVLLSVGVIYLSIVQWRDRRRQGRDKQG